jgi:hypothetical protein
MNELKSYYKLYQREVLVALWWPVCRKSELGPLLK